MTDLVIRPLIAGEEDLFQSLPDPGLVGFAAFGDTYADMAAAGQYRPEWTRVALRDGVVVARAAWWAGPKDDKPLALDWFDFTDQDAAVQLLRTAPLHAEYSLMLPTGWRENPAVRQQAQSRIDAAMTAGLSPLVERYLYRWTPECGVPQRTARLEFRPEPDDTAILDAFRRIHQGSLDAKEVVAAVFASVGAVVVGRRTFDVGLPHWQDTPYPAPTFVLTREARDELAMKSATFTFVTDGVETALKSAQAAAADKDVIVMGAQTGQQLLRAGLLDELQINLVPAVLGAGTRLLDDVGHIEWKRTQVIASDAVTHLRFRVVK
jgi:dihydrofolate reductase